MKKYFSISVCLLIIATGIFFSCASDDAGDQTNATLPTVTTIAPSEIGENTAISGGIVTDNGGAVITLRGICWSTAQNPTTNDANTTVSGTMGVFSSEMTLLAPNTTYYVRAYAKNIEGTAYGAQITFTTAGNEMAMPTVTTAAVTNITATSATLGGDVTEEGESPITERGLCLSTTENPTITDGTYPVDGTTGPFTFEVVDLEPTTTYYVRAYATNAAGTAYGEQMTFTTIE